MGKQAMMIHYPCLLKYYDLTIEMSLSITQSLQIPIQYLFWDQLMRFPPMLAQCLARITSSASLEAAYNTVAASTNFVQFTSYGNSNLRATPEVINTTPSSLISVSSLPTPIISTRTQPAETEKTLNRVPIGSSMICPGTQHPSPAQHTVGPEEVG